MTEKNQFATMTDTEWETLWAVRGGDEWLDLQLGMLSRDGLAVQVDSAIDKILSAGTCWNCGESFAPKRSDARYCSGRCRVAAHRARKAL